MAISRNTKAKKVEVLTKELASSTSAIIGTFAGMTASKDFALRKVVRNAGGSYHVVKNKLAGIASRGSKVEGALQGLKGVSSVAYTSGDPVQLAKALSDWIKDNAEFTFKLGIVDGKVITVEEIGQLATMPGKEELFSKLLFLINSPAQRLATVINATGRDLAVVLGQGVEKEKFAAAAAPAAVTVAVAPEPAAAAPELVAVAPEPESATPEPEPVASAELIPVLEPGATAQTGASSSPAPSDSAEPLNAEAHTEEAPTPAEQIAGHPASEADAVAETSAQPENGTASQAGEAANTEPAEG